MFLQFNQFVNLSRCKFTTHHVELQTHKMYYKNANISCEFVFFNPQARMHR